jgi:universal stress protein A
MKTIKKILCPVDFSEACGPAVQKARALALQLHASLRLVHAISQGDYFVEAYGSSHPGLFEEYERHARAKLEALAKSLATHGLTLETHVLLGRPHDVIVEDAKGARADLIVMATHGRSGLEHLILGSVAERVVRTSPVPVMTVHTADSRNLSTHAEAR